MFDGTLVKLIKFPAEHLTIFHGTLVFRGTPVENHWASDSQLLTAGSILRRNHGLATFAHKRLEWSLVNQSPEQSETEWLCVDVAGYKIINVYKPQRPSRRFHTPVCILVISTTSMSTGVTTSPDGESLDSWATSNNFVLLHNQKETVSFFFRRWKVDTKPDLAFARFGQDPTAWQMCSKKVSSHNIGPPS